MVNITELIQRITDFINSRDEELSKKELKKAISDIYDALTKTDKKVRKSRKNKDSSDSDSSTEKKKRTPTAYNLFMKEQMAILKDSETDDSKMTAKAKMEFIAALWNKEKDAKKDSSEDDADDDSEKKDDDSKKNDGDSEQKDGDSKKKGKAPRKALNVKKSTGKKATDV